ncbi:Predicted dehydrogenase [Arthrobacter sp. 9V]|uniref:Gfo/Idh/MocA family protein n=1 Tax=Arthrobacter sp. 9V TaxID=2653132 RepID=UPI0012F19537|nr:Gfo/Idh/MocA family oxidoreductase [Arthrobacter sp. 9V]VXB66286.1 Predicted dehydrogenase [Arthrobacter sp. 9V]
MDHTSVIRFGILGNAAVYQKALRPAFERSAVAVLAAVGSSKASGAAHPLPTDGVPAITEYTGEGAYQAVIDDPNVDAVYIPLPNHLHKEWTLKAAAAGKHVLCEKPLGVTAADAYDMIRACQENVVHLMEAFMYRYNPQHHRARQIAASGEIGDLRLVRVGFSVPLPSPESNVRFQDYPGAGALHDVGSYGINVCRWMFGTEPTRAHALTANLPGTGADILHTISLEFPDGKMATISGGLGQAYRSFYELVGTTGRIEVERPFATPPFVESDGPLRLKVDTGESTREELFDDESQYDIQIEAFCSLINGHPEQAYSPEDSQRNMHVLDACAASAQSGATELVHGSEVGVLR